MSLKASSIIAYRKIERSVGASTLPWLTPFVIENVSETSPPFLTLTIIPECRLSIIVASIFPQQLPPSSPPNGVKCVREVDKDNIQRSILLHALFLEFLQAEDYVYCATVRMKSAMRLRNHHWVNMALQYISNILVKILPATKRRDIYIGNYHIMFGLLFYRWSL